MSTEFLRAMHKEAAERRDAFLDVTAQAYQHEEDPRYRALIGLLTAIAYEINALSLITSTILSVVGESDDDDTTEPTGAD